MTRIDFYVDASDKLAVAARLVGKARGNRHKVLVYAPDEGTARAIDRLLWTTPPTGFVPHCMAHDPLAAETPVLITRNPDELPHDDVLLNLDREWPPAFARFHRVLEIVGNDEDDKAAARARFRFYRDRGYELHTHNLAASES